MSTEKPVLGYNFFNKALLLEAISHPSSSCQRNYERLEFLGDRVLGLLIAEALLQKFPNGSEGEIAKMYSFLVCQSTLADLARKEGLHEILVLSSGEEKEGGRQRPSNLANVLEALIGAVYQDGGLDSARTLVLSTWNDLLKNPEQYLDSDSKGTLQDILQSYHGAKPAYQLLATKGPSHKPEFTVGLMLPDNCLITGTGKSKKDAERDAASKAIKHLREHLNL